MNQKFLNLNIPNSTIQRLELSSIEILRRFNIWHQSQFRNLFRQLCFLNILLFEFSSATQKKALTFIEK